VNIRRNEKHWSQTSRWRDPPVALIATIVTIMYGSKRANNAAPKFEIGDCPVTRTSAGIDTKTASRSAWK